MVKPSAFEKKVIEACDKHYKKAPKYHGQPFVVGSRYDAGADTFLEANKIKINLRIDRHHSLTGSQEIGLLNIIEEGVPQLILFDYFLYQVIVESDYTISFKMVF